MFERKITASQGEGLAGADRGGAAPESGRVTVLNWPDLSVRFTMAREFRQVMHGKRMRDGGSFNLASAQHLAALGNSKHTVNPIALANGKSTDAMDCAVPSNDEIGIRGRS